MELKAKDWNVMNEEIGANEVMILEPLRAKRAHRDARTLRYLTPDEYPLWDALVEVSPQGSVFCRSWWLKATAGDVRVLGYFNNENLVAGIPLYFEKRLGFMLCTMPKLTHTWGVVMEPLSGKRVTISSREMEILRVFGERLKREKIFVQHFHPNLQNWLPFYWNGFRQTSRCTYLLDNLDDPDRLWSEMRENIRGDIRKAQDQGLMVSPCGADCTFGAITKTFQRQRMRQPYSAEYFQQLYDAAIEKDAGKCFAARDSQGRVHAAAFLVWDRKAAYYLAGGGDPALRNSGATSFLVWHMIQFSAQRSLRFDFEGSVVKSLERFFRAFGAKQVLYNRIMKFPLWVRIWLAIEGKI